MEHASGSSYGWYWTTDFGSYVDGTAHEVGQPAPVDVTSPVVIITAPSAGTDVSRVVTVKVTATDNLGVSRVELYAGDSLVGTDLTSPYQFSWDTSGLAPGARLLEARGYDAAGNVGVATVTVHVSSAPAITTTTTSTTTFHD